MNPQVRRRLVWFVLGIALGFSLWVGLRALARATIVPPPAATSEAGRDETPMLCSRAVPEPSPTSPHAA